MSTVLAIDLGGTHLRAGVAPLVDPAALRSVGDWPAPASREAFVDWVRDQLANTGATHLGIGIPGLTEGARCRWVPNLPFLDGLDVGTAFPVVEAGIGNDAQLALLAEWRAGAAQGLHDAVLLAIGTGIGSAVLAGGGIVSGARGGACSFGWAAVDLDDRGDDRAGWLERHASGRALDALASRRGLSGGSALVNAARHGEPAALGALAEPALALGTALAGAVALLDPEAVILAGGVASALDVLEPMILEAMHRHLPPHLRGIDIRAGTFGPRAGLVGAAFAGARGREWRTHDG